MERAVLRCDRSCSIFRCPSSEWSNFAKRLAVGANKRVFLSLATPNPATSSTTDCHGYCTQAIDGTMPPHNVRLRSIYSVLHVTSLMLTRSFVLKCSVLFSDKNQLHTHYLASLCCISNLRKLCVVQLHNCHDASAVQSIQLTTDPLTENHNLLLRPVKFYTTSVPQALFVGWLFTTPPWR